MGYIFLKNIKIVRVKYIKLLELLHQQGEKNSQYGTCWIHNNKESKKIKKEYVNEYLKSGWVIGRKMKFD